MKIAVTIGDCNGIGIEIMVPALVDFKQHFDKKQDVSFTIFSNKLTLSEYISKTGMNCRVGEEGLYASGSVFAIHDIPVYSPVEFGKVSKSAGLLSSAALESAVPATVSGEYDAIVTMPVSKEALYLAGWNYPGHTEMLAAACRAPKPVMILLAGKFRMALQTIHIPISKVQESINEEEIYDTISLLSSCLKQDFAVGRPRIAILGLNPHAGENGSIGREELDIITPAIKSVDNRKTQVEGPFAADGFFARSSQKNYDAVLAMYHDQGLIPLKMYAKEAGVNYTAGLPIIRTSVDHGTAFDIAGKGLAKPGSALNAIKTAVSIFKNRQKFHKL
jgi:4-hydroxythreonine-4-phosphate dehydrogenase